MKKLVLTMAAVCSLTAYGKGTSKQNPLAGGYGEVSITDSEVLAAAEFAVDEMNSANSSQDPCRLIEILSAKSQVVAGLNYSLVIRVSCKESVETHKVVVFTQAWTHTTVLVSDTLLEN